MDIKGIIFDMDGVLVDNRDIHLEAFRQFCLRYGIRIEREALMPMFGRGNNEILPAILPAGVIKEKGIEALAGEKEAIFREIFEHSIEPAPGLIDFLKEIRRKGIKTAVGSSGGKENVDFVLSRCGITSMFDAVVNGDMVANCKPDPEIFLLAASLLDLTPPQCLVIEDAPAGIQAAQAAGMRVVALATTYPARILHQSNPTLVVSGFNELAAHGLENI